MTGIVQSGNITPGHVLTWAATGVAVDGGALAAAEKVLTKFTSADFNSTSDQALVLPSRITAFMLTRIIITNPSISLTTAVGGFYPAASKGGTALVANTQVYSSLTTASKLLQATLDSAVATTRYSIANLADWAIYLSLTTAQGAAATADVYVCGIDLTA